MEVLKSCVAVYRILLIGLFGHRLRFESLWFLWKERSICLWVRWTGFEVQTFHHEVTLLMSQLQLILETEDQILVLLASLQQSLYLVKSDQYNLCSTLQNLIWSFCQSSSGNLWIAWIQFLKFLQKDLWLLFQVWFIVLKCN